MIKKLLFILLLINTTLLAKNKCEFPPQWNIRNFSFKTHGYTPKQYLLEEDTYGLVDSGSLTAPLRDELSNTAFPFEALNIIAACGNSDAMVELSTIYNDKDIKNYWLQRAIDKGNFMASSYKIIINGDFNTKRRHEANANALLKFYNDTTKKNILRDMALAQLFYLYSHTKIKAKIIITEDMIKYPQYSVSLIAQQHGYDYYTKIEDELSQSFIVWLKKMSKKGSPEASLKLAEYYSIRDYKQTLKYIDEYVYNKQDLEDILYPKYKKTNANHVYRQSRFQIINNIWHNLDENIQNLNKKQTTKEKDNFKNSLVKFQKNIKLHKQYLKELFPNETLESIALMDTIKKQKLLSIKSTPLSTKQKQYIYNIIFSPIEKDTKKIIKDKIIKNQKETKTLFDKLSPQSQQTLYTMSYEFLKNNPTTYKLKSGAIRTTKKRYETTLRRSIQSLAYLEFGAPKKSVFPIYKRLTKFPKKKYNLTLPKESALIAKKIDIFTFSKEYLARKDKYFTPRDIKKKRLEKAALYWLEYVVNNIKNDTNDYNFLKYKKYYIKANYRLAQAYDKNLNDKNLGNKYNQDKVYEFLNNIALNNSEEKPFTSYVNNNYPNEITKFTKYLKKAIKLGSQYKHILSDYVGIPDTKEERDIFDKLVTYNMMFKKNNHDDNPDELNVFKNTLEKVRKLYLKEAKTSLDWYIKYKILQSSYLFNNGMTIDKRAELGYMKKSDMLIINMRNNIINKDLKNKNTLLQEYKKKALFLNNITLRESNLAISLKSDLRFFQKERKQNIYVPYITKLLENESIWYLNLLFSGFVRNIEPK